MEGPTPEHERLQKNVGRWKANCTFFRAPGGPMQLEAEEVVEAFGPYFTTSRFEADFGGEPFLGSAITGYDPRKATWFATWIDTMTPTMFQFTGFFDREEDALILTGLGPDPVHPGREVLYRSKQLWIGDEHRAFDMFIEPEGEEPIPLLAYEYARIESLSSR